MYRRPPATLVRMNALHRATAISRAARPSR
jgi:hypothetical protein